MVDSSNASASLPEDSSPLPPTEGAPDLGALAREVDRLGREVARLSALLEGLAPPASVPTVPINPWTRPYSAPVAPNAPTAPIPPPLPPSSPMAPASAAPRPAPGPQPHPSSPPAPARPDESRIGASALAIAAALLVFFASASLIALLWSRISDDAKIGAIGALALILTAAGTALSLRRGASPSRWRRTLPSATLLGTGGGLGFLAVIGAVLLGVLPDPFIAFLLLSVWGLALILLGTLTRMPLMWIIAALGGASTIELVVHFAKTDPVRAAYGLIGLLVHVLVLTLVTTVACRRWAAALERRICHLSVFALAGISLLRVPLADTAVAQPLLGFLATAAFAPLLLAQALLLARTLAPDSPDRMTWALIWPVSALLLGLGAGRIAEADERRFLDPFAQSEGSFPAFAAILLLLAGILACSLAVALRPLPPAVCAVATHSLSAAVLLVFLARESISGLGLVETSLSALVLIAASIPGVLVGRVEYAATVPLLASPLVFSALSRRDWAGEWTGAALLLLVIAAGVLLDLHSRRHRAADMGSVPPPGPTACSVAAAWVLAALLLVGGAIALDGALLLAEVDRPWYTSAMRIWLFGTASLLIVAGLATNAITPAELFTGQGANRRARPRPIAPQLRRGPGAPVAPLLVTGLGILLMSATFGAELGSTWFDGRSTPDIHTLILCALIAVLALALVRLLLPIAPFGASGIALGAVFLVPIVSIVVLFAPESARSWMGNLALFASAGLCVIVGVRIPARLLRLFGLLAVIIGVAKIALIDMAAQNSTIRIVALLVGGTICFLLSLVYSRFFASTDAARPLDARASTAEEDLNGETHATAPVPAGEQDEPSVGLTP